jgi:hypothetical protein
MSYVNKPKCEQHFQWEVAFYLFYCVGKHILRNLHALYKVAVTTSYTMLEL